MLNKILNNAQRTFGAYTNIINNIGINDSRFNVDFKLDMPGYENVSLRIVCDGSLVSISMGYCDANTEGFYVKFINYVTTLDELYEFLEHDNNEPENFSYFKDNHHNFKPLIESYGAVFESIVKFINDTIKTVWQNDEYTKQLTYSNGDFVLVRVLSEEMLRDNFNRIKFLYERKYEKMKCKARNGLPHNLCYMMLDGEIIDVTIPSDLDLSNFRETTDGVFEERGGYLQWVTYFNDTNKIYSVEESSQACDETMADAWRTNKLNLGLKLLTLNTKIDKGYLVAQDWNDFVF